ncbi:conserved Plasmodium protein, unknown function [Plasmodium ovale]|uniref:Inner centromere protein ARK-binding domain-containing protein n=2 Tax=Plasmodium ovale TaxID=36330 RepID=A0A1A8VZ82_PLAOA|nr:conserved Plasmodium protein, unknown function [Plasmodium ovale curtisi]SBS96214.1 conserved Plasmodium protein, unknown function [Plasmodium ovale curtisi]SCP05365.1 conserved Plasmodium protein, unknown function [Plasmodium ovale]
MGHNCERENHSNFNRKVDIEMYKNVKTNLFVPKKKPNLYKCTQKKDDVKENVEGIKISEYVQGEEIKISSQKNIGDSNIARDEGLLENLAMQEKKPINVYKQCKSFDYKKYYDRVKKWKEKRRSNRGPQIVKNTKTRMGENKNGNVICTYKGNVYKMNTKRKYTMYLARPILSTSRRKDSKVEINLGEKIQHTKKRKEVVHIVGTDEESTRGNYVNNRVKKCEKVDEKEKAAIAQMDADALGKINTRCKLDNAGEKNMDNRASSNNPRKIHPPNDSCKYDYDMTKHKGTFPTVTDMLINKTKEVNEQFRGYISSHIVNIRSNETVLENEEKIMYSNKTLMDSFNNFTSFSHFSENPTLILQSNEAGFANSKRRVNDVDEADEWEVNTQKVDLYTDGTKMNIPPMLYSSQQSINMGKEKKENVDNLTGILALYEQKYTPSNLKCHPLKKGGENSLKGFVKTSIYKERRDVDEKYIEMNYDDDNVVENSNLNNNSTIFTNKNIAYFNRSYNYTSNTSLLSIKNPFTSIYQSVKLFENIKEEGKNGKQNKEEYEKEHLQNCTPNITLCEENKDMRKKTSKRILYPLQISPQVGPCIKSERTTNFEKDDTSTYNHIPIEENFKSYMHDFSHFDIDLENYKAICKKISDLQKEVREGAKSLAYLSRFDELDTSNHPQRAEVEDEDLKMRRNVQESEGEDEHLHGHGCKIGPQYVTQNVPPIVSQTDEESHHNVFCGPTEMETKKRSMNKHKKLIQVGEKGMERNFDIFLCLFMKYENKESYLFCLLFDEELTKHSLFYHNYIKPMLDDYKQSKFKKIKKEKSNPECTDFNCVRINKIIIEIMIPSIKKNYLKYVSELYHKREHTTSDINSSDELQKEIVQINKKIENLHIIKSMDKQKDDLSIKRTTNYEKKIKLIEKPKWSNQKNLKKLLERQQNYNPFTIFGTSIKEVILEEIFTLDVYNNYVTNEDRFRNKILYELYVGNFIHNLYQKIDKDEWDFVLDSLKKYWTHFTSLECNMFLDPLLLEEILWYIDNNKMYKDKSKEMYTYESCFCPTPDPEKEINLTDIKHFTKSMAKKYTSQKTNKCKNSSLNEDGIHHANNFILKYDDVYFDQNTSLCRYKGKEILTRENLLFNIPRPSSSFYYDSDFFENKAKKHIFRKQGKYSDIYNEESPKCEEMSSVIKHKSNKWIPQNVFDNFFTNYYLYNFGKGNQKCSSTI